MIVRSLLTLLLLACLLFSCERVRTDPPVRTSLDTLLVPPSSTLTVPLRFSLDSIESIINEKLRGTFLKNRIAVNENDSLYFELTNLKPIRLTWRAPDLRYIAHLNVSAKYMKKILGVKVENEKPIEFEVELQLKTELGFEQDWSIRPATEIEQIVWKKDPILELGVATINFRKPVEKALIDNRGSLTSKLDDFVRETVDTRKVVARIWSDMQQPIRLRKEVPRLWLLLEGESLKARWTRDSGRRITAQAEVTGKIRTLVEGEDREISPLPLPPFSFRTSQQDSLVASVLCRLPFKIANEYLRKALVGMAVDTSGYRAMVEDLEVYGTDEGLAVKLAVSGDLKGNVYFRGKPVIERASRTFKIQDFEFDVDSEDAVMSSADWFLHSSIKSLIEEQLTVDLRPYTEMLPYLITSGIEEGKLGDKLKVNIQSWEVIPITTAITVRDIQMIVQVRGMADIELQDIRKDTTGAPSLPGQ